MKVQDRFGWNGMQALIEDAAAGGVDLDETQVRCPLLYAPKKVQDPPWLGEFKVVGRGGKKHWRLYFGEPINRQDHVVRIHLWHKLRSWSKADAGQRQQDSVANAMGLLKWHFKKEGYEWSQF
ncbi:hypothetical protein [Gordonia malaquae]|uniref:hypothetical protein n=1 Tax=Gordonia malaquae TaxID=410332 RepID=UPI0030167498